MPAVETVSSSILADLLRASLMEKLQGSSPYGETFAERMARLARQNANLPAVADENTLYDLVSGKYNISLAEYTDLSSYNTVMSNLFGDSSANNFQNTLSGILGYDLDNGYSSAKNFLDAMRENGMSNQDALKMYTALQKYSLMSNLNNYNFVNAKI